MPAKQFLPNRFFFSRQFIISLMLGIKTWLLAAIFLYPLLALPHSITTSNFKELFSVDYSDFHSSGEVNQREWLIMFYAPWCGFCKRALPVFQDFSRQLVNTRVQEAEAEGVDIDEYIAQGVQTGLIDCVTDEDICQYFNIRAYPTFYYLTADKRAVAYEGPRSIDGFYKVLKSHDPDQGHENVKWGVVNFGIIDLFKEAFTLYWQYILGFGVILPIFVGYFLAECMNRRERRKVKARIEAQRAQKVQQITKTGQSPSQNVASQSQDSKKQAQISEREQNGKTEHPKND